MEEAEERWRDKVAKARHADFAEFTRHASYFFEGFLPSVNKSRANLRRGICSWGNGFAGTVVLM